MRIVVCVKLVPATTKVRVDPERGTIIREGIPSTINPYDRFALEAALRLKDAAGAEVVALTMGPPQAEEILREAASLGADRVVLLSDRAFAGSDVWATSYTLAGAVHKLGGADLILCGLQSIDGETGQVAPELAEMLGMPVVTYAGSISFSPDGKGVVIRRTLEDCHEEVFAPLPAVVSVTKEIGEVRVPSLRGMIASKSLQATVWTAEDLGGDERSYGLGGSPTRVTKVYEARRERSAQMVEGADDELVSAFVGILVDQGVLQGESC